MSWLTMILVAGLLLLCSHGWLVWSLIKGRFVVRTRVNFGPRVRRVYDRRTDPFGFWIRWGITFGAVTLLVGDDTLTSWLRDRISSADLEKLEEIRRRATSRMRERLPTVINRNRMRAVDRILKEVETRPRRKPGSFLTTLGNLSMPLAREVCQMVVATLVTAAQAPLAPEGFRLADVGTGGSLRASWEAGAEPDLAGYVLRWGNVSRMYTDSVVLSPEKSYVIDGLSPESLYYATVSALDSSGFEGPWSVEDSAVPRDVPQRPAG